MKNNFFIYITGALMGLAMTTSAGAMQLDYDEAVSGDIISGSSLGSLDFGINTVAGTVTFRSGSFDLDFFDVALPTSGILDSINLVLSNGANGNNSVPGTFKFTLDGNANSEFPLSFGPTLIPVELSGNNLTHVGFDSFWSGMEINYTITFNVSSASVVPVPAALPLFGTGLAVLGLIGWRRKRKAA